LEPQTLAVRLQLTPVVMYSASAAMATLPVLSMDNRPLVAVVAASAARAVDRVAEEATAGSKSQPLAPPVLPVVLWAQR